MTHGGRHDPRRQGGAVSLEAALLLPVIALLTLAVLRTVGVARDVLVVHEAARAGARAAATTVTDGPPTTAARAAADGRPVDVRITPAQRRPGEIVTVEVELADRLGPLPYRVAARAVAQVEPGASG